MFKVGDKVRIAATSEYYRSASKSNPMDTIGTIFKVNKNADFCYKVQWPSGRNSYKLEDLETAYPNPPHKHRDIIIAWANGAEIEHKLVCSGGWRTADSPRFVRSKEYRIKQTKSPAQIEKESIVAEMEKLQERLDNLEVE